MPRSNHKQKVQNQSFIYIQLNQTNGQDFSKEIIPHTSCTKKECGFLGQPKKLRNLVNISLPYFTVKEMKAD
jgi:hypothetical protein